MFLNPITLAQQASALYSIPRLSGKTHLFFSEPESDEYVAGNLDNGEGQSRALSCNKAGARQGVWAMAKARTASCHVPKQGRAVTPGQRLPSHAIIILLPEEWCPVPIYPASCKLLPRSQLHP